MLKLCFTFYFFEKLAPSWWGACKWLGICTVQSRMEQ